METLAPRELLIRPVKAEDVSEVSKLEEASFKDPFPPYFLSQLAEANPETFLVAIFNGKMVGYVVVDIWTEEQHLVSIAVAPGVRRRGIGQALLNGLVDRLREGRLGLELRKSNSAALDLYLKNGFHQTGIVHSYYTDGEDAIKMEKMVTKKTAILSPA